MRFEVKGGGIAGILFALTLLSGSVFVLGLLAGYDVGRQAQIDTAQLATTYPLQSPPSSAAPSHPSPPEPDNPAMQSASTSASPAAGTSTSATAPSAGPATLAGESTNPKRRSSPPSATPERQRLVSASGTRPASTRDSAAADENAAAPDSENSEAVDEPSETTSNSSLRAGHSGAAVVRHKAYNIQIEAAMDISGADKMLARLQKLGYSSHLVPTEIAGQRWYKVEVGPYATAEEASSAEAEMRQKYDQTYGRVARGNSGQTSANDNSDE
jgi:septal ring-binding cell division protein DamX